MLRESKTGPADVATYSDKSGATFFQNCGWIVRQYRPATSNHQRKTAMKTTSFVTLSALLASCAFAVAEDKPTRPDRPQRELPPALLEKFDTDKDGKLSDEERKTMRTEMEAKREQFRAKMLEKFDTDKDGKLSDAEKSTMREAMKARHQEMLAKYDANKDGKLDKSEIQAARDAGEELPPPGMGDGPGKPGKRGEGKPAGPPVE
jgi:Ca2+-binding EF-hand superfamily protein